MFYLYTSVWFLKDHALAVLVYPSAWQSPSRLEVFPLRSWFPQLKKSTLTSILQATPRRRPTARQDLPLYRTGPRVTDSDVADCKPRVHSHQGAAAGDQHRPDASAPAVHARRPAGDHGLLQLGVDGGPSQCGAGVGPGAAGEDQQLGRSFHGVGLVVGPGRGLTKKIPRRELSHGGKASMDIQRGDDAHEGVLYNRDRG